MGISRDTVKSFCRRNDNLISGSKDDTYTTVDNKPADSEPVESEPMYSDNIDDKDRCRQCGKPIEQKDKQKRRIFCCKSCREKWWAENADKINRKAVYTFTCAGCGQTFTAYGNKNRKYCSHGCYIADRFVREHSTISVGVGHADKERADG